MYIERLGLGYSLVSWKLRRRDLDILFFQLMNIDLCKCLHRHICNETKATYYLIGIVTHACKQLGYILKIRKHILYCISKCIKYIYICINMLRESLIFHRIFSLVD